MVASAKLLSRYVEYILTVEEVIILFPGEQLTHPYIGDDLTSSLPISEYLILTPVRVGAGGKVDVK
jgi:hypothetical protein